MMVCQRCEAAVDLMSSVGDVAVVAVAVAVAVDVVGVARNCAICDYRLVIGMRSDVRNRTCIERKRR